MNHALLFTARGLAALTIALLLSSPAGAADGKPFLMQIGTGQDFKQVNSGPAWDSVASVSITPKKSGFCAVTASANLYAPAPAGDVGISIGTTEDDFGPWGQFHNFTNDSWSAAMTQAFVITKDVPVTFYLSVNNTTGNPIQVEATRIWTICSAVKEPVLP